VTKSTIEDLIEPGSLQYYVVGYLPSSLIVRNETIDNEIARYATEDHIDKRLYKIRAVSELYCIHQTNIAELKREIKSNPILRRSVFLLKDFSPIGIPFMISIRDDYGGEISYDGLLYYFKCKWEQDDVDSTENYCLRADSDEYTLLLKQLKDVVSSYTQKEPISYQICYYNAQLSTYKEEDYVMYHLAKCIDQSAIKMYPHLGRIVAGKSFYIYFGSSENVLQIVSYDLVLMHEIYEYIFQLESIINAVKSEWNQLKETVSELSSRLLLFRGLWKKVKNSVTGILSQDKRILNLVEIFNAVEYSLNNEIGYRCPNYQDIEPSMKNIMNPACDNLYKWIKISDGSIVAYKRIENPIYSACTSTFGIKLKELKENRDSALSFGMKLLTVIQTEYTTLAAYMAAIAVIIAICALVISA